MAELQTNNASQTCVDDSSNPILFAWLIHSAMSRILTTVAYKLGLKTPNWLSTSSLQRVLTFCDRNLCGACQIAQLARCVCPHQGSIHSLWAQVIAGSSPAVPLGRGEMVDAPDETMRLLKLACAALCPSRNHSRTASAMPCIQTAVAYKLGIQTHLVLDQTPARDSTPRPELVWGMALNRRFAMETLPVP